MNACTLIPPRHAVRGPLACRSDHDSHCRRGRAAGNAADSPWPELAKVPDLERAQAGRRLVHTRNAKRTVRHSMRTLQGGPSVCNRHLSTLIRPHPSAFAALECAVPLRQLSRSPDSLPPSALKPAWPPPVPRTAVFSPAECSSALCTGARNVRRPSAARSPPVNGAGWVARGAFAPSRSPVRQSRRPLRRHWSPPSRTATASCRCTAADALQARARDVGDASMRTSQNTLHIFSAMQTMQTMQTMLARSAPLLHGDHGAPHEPGTVGEPCLRRGRGCMCLRRGRGCMLRNGGEAPSIWARCVTPVATCCVPRGEAPRRQEASERSHGQLCRTCDGRRRLHPHNVLDAPCNCWQQMQSCETRWQNAGKALRHSSCANPAK